MLVLQISFQSELLQMAAWNDFHELSLSGILREKEMMVMMDLQLNTGNNIKTFCNICVSFSLLSFFPHLITRFHK